MVKNIAVIGGGAAGMMAAIAAATAGSRVVIYEKNDRVGKKLLATGNGKCNLSNKDMDICHYNTAHPDKVIHILESFTVADTIGFFNEAGMLIGDRNGYLYPAAEQAAVVLDILRLQLFRRGITVHCGCEVTMVKKSTDGRFRVSTGAGQADYDKVIIACGSRAALKAGEAFGGYRLAEAAGHHIIKVVPALVQLRCQEECLPLLKILAGVRCQAAVKLIIKGETKASEHGELQFTDYGLSGIPVFQLSREAAYALQRRDEVIAEVDFFPDESQAAYEDFCRDRLERYQDREGLPTGAGLTLTDFLLGIAHKKINQAMIKIDGCHGAEPVSDVGAGRIRALMGRYKALRLPIKATNPFTQAQVCAGGVSMAEVDEHLQSQMVPGLYFAGEILDVDGKCGGYNLQWAWSGGYAAGRHAAGG